MREVRATLGRLEPLIVRIDATLPHLATKAELAELIVRIDATLPQLATKADLAEKPGKLYLWGVLAALIAAYAAGLAALAILR